MDYLNTSILSSKQFDQPSLNKLFDLSDKMVPFFTGQEKTDLLKGKIMSTIFFEPSTRTRFSFEIAMQKLGGAVVSNSDMVKTSSVKKQETLYDTGKVLSQMVDLIVMRHPKPYTVMALDEGSDVPVINAGDGVNDHPTQGLLDIYTIYKNFNKKIDGLKIGMVGDLKHSRVIHAQCNLLRNYDIEFVFISPKGLRIPSSIKRDIKKYTETEDLYSVIGDVDVVSHTRIQEERFKTEEEYLKYKGVYVIDKKSMELAKQDMIILSPLPRVDELTKDVDDDKRAKYFEQVKNGVLLRMALITLVLGEKI